MTDAEQTQIEGRPLLLYDGVCVLCNGVVRFILKHDGKAAFRFTPLESTLGRKILARFDLTETPDGVVLITATLTHAEHIYHRSDAVAEALQLLGGPWKPVGKALGLLPRPLREFGYTIIASLRYRLFGRYATCPLPTAKERSQLLGIDKSTNGV